MEEKENSIVNCWHDTVLELLTRMFLKIEDKKINPRKINETAARSHSDEHIWTQSTD